MKCAVHCRDPINTMHFSFIYYYIIKKRQTMHQKIIKTNIDSRNYLCQANGEKFTYRQLE